MSDTANILLFSYGTLQLEAVQIQSFGRLLDGEEDAVEGKVFWITAAELAAADAYEVDDYQRILVPLRSGRQAWVYVARLKTA